MNIYESIAAIMNEGYAITKAKKNVQQGFMYRGIDDVMNTFQPLLSKYKVFVVPEVLTAEREERHTKSGNNLIFSVLRLKYTFYAEDGSSVSAVVIGEGMDSGDKASNKAMAVGMKYAMFQVFCIPTEEMREADPDKTTPEPSEPAPKKEPGMFICEDCGNVLKPVEYEGAKYGVRQIAAGAYKKYEKVLCWDCYTKHNEMKEATKSA